MYSYFRCSRGTSDSTIETIPEPLDKVYNKNDESNDPVYIWSEQLLQARGGDAQNCDPAAATVIFQPQPKHKSVNMTLTDCIHTSA